MLRRALVAAAAILSIPAMTWAAAERGWFPLAPGAVPAGTADGTAPTSRGTIVLAPEKKALASPPSPYLWSLAVRRGAVIAGSGDGGEIWRLPEDGGAAALLYDAPELQAQALSVGADGRLFAALNPGARIAAIDEKGTASDLFKPPSGESYAWAILPDPDGHSLHVAVGSPGRVYRVEPGRATAAKVELESGDGAVRSLAFAKDGRLLAGTDGKGLVIRVDGDGKKFVLYDAPRREISSISVAPDGTIWFAAIGDEGTPAAPGAAATPTPAATPLPPPTSGPPALLFRMRPDGFAEAVWQAPGASIFSVAADDGGAFVSTGDPGAVWRIDSDLSSRKVLDPSAGQATALLPQPGGDLLVATANPSKVFRLRSARSGSGTFEASPLDAAGFSHWGRLTWQGTTPSGSKIEIATRSGNTATPDSSWSGWSAPIPSSGGEVTSPAARYLQWRATMSGPAGGSGPELSQMLEIFRVENRAPRVDWILVEDPGTTIAPKADAPPSYTLPPDAGKPPMVRAELPNKRGYQRGWRAARWAGSDPDGDHLLYDVFLRGVGEPAWIPIATGIPETYTTWDETSVPDGRYELKVIARDEAENGAGAGRTGERTSQSFLVDTTAPRVESVSATRAADGLRVVAVVTDAGSGVDHASVSLDGGPWLLLVAKDGISDSDRESFEVTLPGVAPGAHLVTIKAEDVAGNDASGKTLVK